MKSPSKHAVALLSLLALGAASRALYAQSALRVAGRAATQGVHDFRPAAPGATMVFPFTTTGAVAASQSLTTACRGGWVGQRPDIILRLRSEVPALRVWVTGARDASAPAEGRPSVYFSGATLVVNGADGRWRCEGSFGVNNPQVLLTNAGVGQYDIWVGSNSGATTISGELHVASVPFVETRGDSARAGVQELSDTSPETLDLPLAPRAPGDVELRPLGEACLGTAPRQPDLIVRLPSALPLVRLSATTTADSTLVVRTPDDRWRCNVARGGGDPLVMLRDAPAGQYEVWVGSRLGANIGGTLHATRAPIVETGGAAGTLGVREITPTFSPDPMEVVIPQRPAGPIDGRLIQSNCAGRIERRPDLVLRVGAPLSLLRAYVTSTVDTTLLVHGPDDTWRCDDDSFGSFNPLVDLTDLTAGQYEVWVGGFNPSSPVSGTLHVTRSSLVETGGAAAALGVRELAPGFTPEPIDLELTPRTGGEVDARLLSRGCGGLVTRRPDVILRVGAPMPLLRAYVTSPVDTTLVVHGPDDSWTCNDNFDPRSGNRNPLVDLTRVARGQYEVWVGTSARSTAVTGQLHLARSTQHHP
jgi:hypothetical protein